MTASPSAVAAGVDVPGYTISELVNESGPWVTYRGTAPDGTRVTIKTARAQYPRARDLAELRREFEVLSRLAVPGSARVRALVPHGSGNLALITEAFGRPLPEILAERAAEPLPLDAFFSLVIRLARILGAGARGEPGAKYERKGKSEHRMSHACLVNLPFSGKPIARTGRRQGMRRNQGRPALAPRIGGFPRMAARHRRCRLGDFA